MLIDINTYIGHWAFRALPDNTAEGLLRRMDACGIDRAVVASIHGLLYKDVHSANVELAAETRAFRDRLIPWTGARVFVPSMCRKGWS